MQSTLGDLHLILTPKAKEDLESIWRYTEQEWSLDQADRYLDALNAAFTFLTQFPKAARERAEFTPPVRLYPTGKHLIVYLVSEGELQVVRVLHNRRNWQVILGE